MRKAKQIRRLAWLLAAAIPALAGCAGGTTREGKTAVAQRTFASSEEATQALLQATQSGDKAALHEIFGPDVRYLLTGDKVQDQADFKAFSRAMAEGCAPVAEGEDTVVLDIGKARSPFAIPIVKTDGRWRFDTDAGMEEIINRHIGMDEMYAIGVCRAYVTAQYKYFSKVRDESGVRKYALKFKSSPGKEDGLYWKSEGEASPFGPLVAEAHAEGYGKNPKGSGPHPFHGYVFRILTRQGSAAPGGERDYVVNGDLTAGFALVAYPARWGKSGIMTFTVNQDGKVYQRNLGEETADVAGKIAEYNPGSDWTLVTEPGISEP